MSVYSSVAVDNKELIAILMDKETFPNGTPTANGAGHVINTRRHAFLSANFVNEVTLGGVGPDGVYRDPWGNPYIITIDSNMDEKCQDALYKLNAVSLNGAVGFDGLVGTGANDYQYSGSVMVWSGGPDKKIANTGAAAKSNSGVNKDNVCTWKQ